MRVPSFKPVSKVYVTPGTQRELDRALDQIEQLSNSFGQRGMRTQIGSYGSLSTLDYQPGILAEITGKRVRKDVTGGTTAGPGTTTTGNPFVPSGTIAYSWTQILKTYIGVQDDWPDGPAGGMTLNTTDINTSQQNWPAYEDDDNDVPIGSWVWLRFGAGEWMEFSHPTHGFLARIKEYDALTQSYGWVQLERDSVSGFFYVLPEGMSGTAGGYNAAYERNNHHAVPYGSVVYVRRAHYDSATGLYTWEFDYEHFEFPAELTSWNPTDGSYNFRELKYEASGQTSVVANGLTGKAWEDERRFAIPLPAVVSLRRGYVNTGTLITEDFRFTFCCGTKPTTTPGGTTTAGPCSGKCKWSWDDTTKLWGVITNGCSGTGCSCDYPTYCGKAACEYTYTSCSKSVKVPPCCNFLATTTPGGTTTLDPTGCSGACTWYGNIDGFTLLISNTCSYGCGCRSPGLLSCDSTTVMPCYKGGTTVPPTCSGTCDWTYSTSYGRWIWMGRSSCQEWPNTGACGCSPPTYTGVTCEIAKTPCLSASQTTTISPGGTTTTGTTTTCSPQYPTTPNPLTCQGYCRYNWSGSAWVLISTAGCSFSTCHCQAPSWSGTSTCDFVEMPCFTGPPTTTSTTSTTPAPCGTCRYLNCINPDNAWYLVTSSCTGTCQCVPPSYPPNNDCEVSTVYVDTKCKEPSPCGFCTYTGCDGPWTQLTNGCTGLCRCVPPAVPSPPCSESGPQLISTFCAIEVTTSTTTTTPSPCTGGSCIWASDGSGGWYLLVNQCQTLLGQTCGCTIKPPRPSSLNYPETYWTACYPTTTTTSAPTTSPGGG